ncbi:MAG TPA: hypothetical protein VMU30_00935 [Bacteroidota bacterium]|nr:hypothetical protein [Bacteroidota bacterium]
MSDLKNLQSELCSSITSQGIPANILDAYPSFYGFETGFLFPLFPSSDSSLLIGGVYEYNSTGGRIHYQDYSGEVRADQIVSTNAFGCMIKYQLSSQNEFHWALFGSCKYYYSVLHNSLYTRIGTYQTLSEPAFHSSSLGVEIGIAPFYNLWNFHLGVQLSYLLFFPSSLEYDNYSDAYLENNNGENVRIDWSGFRLGLFIEYPF